MAGNGDRKERERKRDVRREQRSRKQNRFAFSVPSRIAERKTRAPNENTLRAHGRASYCASCFLYLFISTRMLSLFVYAGYRVLLFFKFFFYRFFPPVAGVTLPFSTQRRRRRRRQMQVSEKNKRPPRFTFVRFGAPFLTRAYSAQPVVLSLSARAASKIHVL